MPWRVNFCAWCPFFAFIICSGDDFWENRLNPSSFRRFDQDSEIINGSSVHVWFCWNSVSKSRDMNPYPGTIISLTCVENSSLAICGKMLYFRIYLPSPSSTQTRRQQPAKYLWIRLSQQSNRCHLIARSTSQDGAEEARRQWPEAPHTALLLELLSAKVYLQKNILAKGREEYITSSSISLSSRRHLQS